LKAYMYFNFVTVSRYSISS